MESFDAEGEDKRGGQVLSTELHTKVVEAFEVFDHENNKTVDVREVVLHCTVLYCTVLHCTGGDHRAEPRALPQRVAAAGGDRRDGGPRADGLHPPGQVPARHVQVTVFNHLISASIVALSYI